MERRIAAQQGALLCVAAAVALLLSDRDDWSHPSLLVLLLFAALISDRLSVTVGAMRVTMVDLGIGLAAILGGPGPGVAMAIAVMALDAWRARLPLHAALANVASYATAALIAAALVGWLRDGGTIVEGEGSFALVAMGAMFVFKVVNLLVVVQARSVAGMSPREEMRETILPLLPWDGVTVGLAGATAHAYVTLGVGAVVVLLWLLLFLHRLLENIGGAQERERELARVMSDRDRYRRESLAAEERERGRLAAELHDDALQTLLSARSDLVEGLEGDEERLRGAHDAVAETIRKLRDLMVRLGPEPSAGPLAPAIRELAQRIGRREAFDVEVAIDEDLAQTEDALAVGIVRELLVNAAKHSKATRVHVRVELAGERMRIEVRDNGVGVDELDRVESLAGGHVGLALVEQRAQWRGGTLTIASAPGGGTVASTVMDCIGPATVEHAQN